MLSDARGVAFIDTLWRVHTCFTAIPVIFVGLEESITVSFAVFLWTVVAVSDNVALFEVAVTQLGGTITVNVPKVASNTNKPQATANPAGQFA